MGLDDSLWRRIHADVIAWPVAPLNLLVLSGSGFSVPHLVSNFIGTHLEHRLVERGDHVPLCTRGRPAAALPANVNRLIGHRDAKDATGKLAIE